MVAPCWSIHFTVIFRIFCYVKSTLSYGLQFSSQLSLVLSGYSNADWVGDSTCYCVDLSVVPPQVITSTWRDSLISYKRSKKRIVVSHSSTYSEYGAVVDATSELLWFQ